MKNVTSSEPVSTVSGANDTRRDLRLACDPTVAPAHLDGRQEPVAVRVVEVSKSGLQLSADEPMPIGAIVHIDLGGIMVEGEIRHCQMRSDDHSYAVGVLMRDVKDRE